MPNLIQLRGIAHIVVLRWRARRASGLRANSRRSASRWSAENAGVLDRRRQVLRVGVGAFSLLVTDEARRIAANVAKLPGFTATPPGYLSEALVERNLNS